jgi:hypothetical protein
MTLTCVHFPPHRRSRHKESNYFDARVGKADLEDEGREDAVEEGKRLRRGSWEISLGRAGLD